MAIQKLPSITIISCSLNPDIRIFTKSLKAIQSQNYPEHLIEHIVMDGGSTNGSDALAKQFGCIVVKRPDLKNNALKRMGIGIKRAKKSLILILEPDNIIIGKNWLQMMVQPFIDDKSIVGTFSAYNTYEKKMPILTKYYALFGVTDTLLYYLHKSEKLPLYKERYDKGKVLRAGNKYTTVIFNKKNLPTLGDNGHMVRRRMILQENRGDIFLHTDAFCNLLNNGYNRYGVVNNSIIHFAGSSALTSFKKRILYKNTFSKYKRSYLVFDKSSKRDLLNVLLFGIYTLTIVQPLGESIRGYLSKREPAWFLHPVMCYGTFFSYSFSAISNSVGSLFKRYAA